MVISLQAAMIPFAIVAQSTMPPKMLTKIALTCVCVGGWGKENRDSSFKLEFLNKERSQEH